MHPGDGDNGQYSGDTYSNILNGNYQDICHTFEYNPAEYGDQYLDVETNKQRVKITTTSYSGPITKIRVYNRNAATGDNQTRLIDKSLTILKEGLALNINGSQEYIFTGNEDGFYGNTDPDFMELLVSIPGTETESQEILPLVKIGDDDVYTLTEAVKKIRFTDTGNVTNDYQDEENLEQLFTVAEGSRIRISGSVATENNYDYLRIFDGPTSESSMFINGEIDSADPVEIDYTSTGNNVFFQFESDGSWTNTGWNLIIEIINTEEPTVSYIDTWTTSPTGYGTGLGLTSWLLKINDTIGIYNIGLWMGSYKINTNRNIKLCKNSN